MRRVGLSDLDVAARVLLALPQSNWSAMAARLIEDAHTADLWRKRYGTAHPSGATGSLYAQASLEARVAASACGTQYCAALAAVLHALRAWRLRINQEL